MSKFTVLLVGLILLSITLTPANAQQVAISLGSGISVPGGTLAMDVSLTTSGGAQPAVFQWTMSYSAADIASVSVTDGPTATAAGKSILCSSTPGSTVCVAYGVNQNIISDGVAATATFSIASGALDTSAPVQVTGVSASAPAATGISALGTGATISISQTSQPPVASGLSCIPASVTAPGTSACIVTLSAPAQTGGMSVTLANNNSNVSIPGSLVVPPGSSSAGFTATVAAITKAQSASLTASAGGVSKNFSLGIAPPLWSISGTISPPSGGSGATVTLTGAGNGVVTADASGNYSFSGLLNGTYTVTPSKSGYAYNPTSQSVTINGASLTGINFTDPVILPANSITVDATAWQDQSTAASTVTASGLSTVSGNELLLAFISTDATGAGTTVTNVSGAGLTWELAVRTNMQAGTSEIWRAFASAPLSNVSITATLSQSVASSMTVMSFSGVDTSGSFGSGAIGASGSGYAAPGAPTATLITTRNNSWVFGVGNDYDTATPRTLGSGQSMVHQSLPSISGVAVDAFWVQMQTNPTPASGTSVTINDTAPTTDQYNLSIVEILPPLSTGPQTWSISGSLGSSGSGATMKLSGAMSVTITADTSGNYAFTGLANGTYTVTPSKTGYTFSPASQSVTVNTANLSGVNFTAVPQTWSLSGTISPSSTGSGATVTLAGPTRATATADASGNYTFSGLPNGAYTVAPSKAGYTFSPASQSVTINSANLSGVNFTAAPQTWSLSGTISPSSTGSGATVALGGASNATVTADASGNYTFQGLGNGTYTVTPSKSGYSFSPANQSVTISSANVTGINFSTNVQTALLAIDARAFRNNSSGSEKVVSPKFSTSAGNELLLAFISTGYAGGTNTTVTSVSGAGLTWALVARTNIQSGTSEIWRAFAPAALTNGAVTAKLSQSVASSMTVMSFKGVDPSGTNGSGAIGATGSGHASSGAPVATLTTTRNNSWVFGVGNDYNQASGRTPGPGQSMVHQALPNTSGVAADTFWVQMQNSPTPLSGTSVTINDTAPTTDRYNLSIVEILPALTVTTANAPAQAAGETQRFNLMLSNAATALRGDVCSPGSLATLSGTGLTAQAAETATSFPLPTRLADVQVDVNGAAAPLLFVSDSRVIFQCPLLPPGSPLEIALKTENGVSASRVQSLMQAAAPGLFTWGTAGQGVIMNAATNEIAMPKTKGIASRPAVPGEYISIFANGLGEVIDGVTAGTQAPDDRLVLLTNKIKVILGGIEIDPAFAGLAPGTVGLFQVNAQLPPDVPVGLGVPLYLKLILADGSVVSSNTVTMAISSAHDPLN